MISLRTILKIIRSLLYKLKYPILYIKGNRIGRSSFIGKNVILSNSCIGKYVYLGNGCVCNNVVIGNYTQIAPYVQIGGMEHSYWQYSTSTLLSDDYICDKKTEIGPDVWIGAGCIIKQGVKIGQGVVIGAHSLVTKNVPPYAIVFGSPAKIYKYRFSKEEIKELIKSNYYQFSPKKAKDKLAQIKKIYHLRIVDKI